MGLLLSNRVAVRQTRNRRASLFRRREPAGVARKRNGVSTPPPPPPTVANKNHLRHAIAIGNGALNSAVQSEYQETVKEDRVQLTLLVSNLIQFQLGFQEKSRLRQLSLRQCYNLAT